MALLTHLDVANAACALIGEDPLESFGTDSFGGQQAQQVYEATVKFNLGVYQFGFAKQLRQLSLVDGATPLSGFTSVFDLPPERLGPPLYLTDDPTDPDCRFSRYVLVGATAHADATALCAMILFMPEPYLWSPTFLLATVTAIASKYAISMATDRALGDQLSRDAYGAPNENYRGGQFGAAIRAEAYATPPRPTDWARRNPLIDAWRS